MTQQSCLLRDSEMKTNVSLPVVLNHHLLNSKVRFRPQAKLKSFLVQKTGADKELYFLKDLLIMLKEVIRKEGLYDPGNPSVIICSSELETALERKALHVSQIRELVLDQVVSIDGDLERDTEQTLQDPTIPPRTLRTASITTSYYTKKKAEFFLKADFLKAIRTVSGADQTKIIFTYDEIMKLLSKYILQKKDKLFDHRNPELAIVKDDPIGIIFGVQAFHRSQTSDFVKEQIDPVDPLVDVGVNITTRLESPGVSVSVTRTLGE